MPKVEVFNRDLVIEQVSNVFHEKGYNATSMQDLVNASGLNRSSIYNSFQNKLNLYLECLKAYEAKYQRKTSELLLKADSPIKAIESIFKLYLSEIMSDKKKKGCMLVNCKSEMANQESTLKHFLMNHQSNTLTLLEDLIHQGQQSKIINSFQTSKAYALYLFSVMQGFRMTGILVDNKQQLQSVIDTTLQNLN